MHNIRERYQLIDSNFSMFIQHNYLSLIRKKTSLTQIDVASIMKLPDFANVSRWESGQREPNLQALIFYELLFSVPVTDFYERLKKELVPILANGIMKRIEELKSASGDSNTPKRIEYMQSVFTRLASMSV